MRRPLSSNRPLGPFAQRSTPNGVTLVYTVDNIRDIPSTAQLENILDEAYKSARTNGRDEVVASDPDVDTMGSPRSGTRAIKINTGVTIMNIDQFDAVRDVTTEVMEEVGANITQTAVAVSSS